jgi:hypothetical protein
MKNVPDTGKERKESEGKERKKLENEDGEKGRKKQKGPEDIRMVRGGRRLRAKKVS